MIFLASSQLTFTCSKSTIETLEKGVKYVFIVNFEHISHLFLVLPFVDFEQVNVSSDANNYQLLPTAFDIDSFNCSKRKNLAWWDFFRN